MDIVFAFILIICPFLFVLFLVLYCLGKRKISKQAKINVTIANALIETQETLKAAQTRLADMEPQFGNFANLAAEERRLQTNIDSLVAKTLEVSQIYDEAYETEMRNRKLQLEELDKDILKIRDDYSKKREIYDRLIKEVAIFDERLSFAEMGVYEPHFDFDSSDKYKQQIEKIRSEQKIMVKSQEAVFCNTVWHVEGSVAKGKVLINNSIKLVLRAFNNECDAAIANARWNNAIAMEKRIIRASEQIAKLVDAQAIVLSEKYLSLKLKELQLTHEYKEKLKHEKDERAEMARLAREEQKLLRDLEKAEEDEDNYKRLLKKAKAEAQSLSGEKLTAFEEKIKLLEEDLQNAHARVERAQAMAERTRSGYIYIISNIGSFGEGIFKIGLTRRLDPMDRVRELGSASVPFIFDVHAIIYSDDAPALEYSLHKEFDKGRVNMINPRKEFFNVSINEVREAVNRLAPDAPFFDDIEAQDYKETLAKRHQELFPDEDKLIDELPKTI